MKRFLVAFSISGALAASAFAQNADIDSSAPDASGRPLPATGIYPPVSDALLYDNGPLITPICASLPAGSNQSECQGPIGGLTNTVAGWLADLVEGPNTLVADDFTVPAGETWNLTDVVFPAYQTGATTATVNKVVVAIYNADPSTLVPPIYGDETTNVIQGATTLSNTYRNFNLQCLTGRRIQVVTAKVTASLPAGNYWMAWSFEGTAASGPWAPPVTIPGQLGKPGGNCYQRYLGAWVPLTDTGSGVPQDFAFVINGTKQGGGCKWDLNGDGKVCQEDLGILLAGYGTQYNQSDLGELLAQYNGGCGNPC